MRALILGAGAHAREVCDWLLHSRVEVAGFYADVPGPSRVRGLPIFANPAGVPKDSRWVVGVGSPPTAFHLARACGVPAHPAVVHPSCVVGSNVQVGDGTVVCPGAVLTTDVRIGDGCVVNVGATVSHDSLLEPFVCLSPNVSLSGRTHLERGVVMGTGSCTIPGVRIGAHSVVGAGATVVADLPSGIHAGVPARTLRSLEESERF